MSTDHTENPHPGLMPNHPIVRPGTERLPVSNVNTVNPAGGYVRPEMFNSSKTKLPGRI